MNQPNQRPPAISLDCVLTAKLTEQSIAMAIRRLVSLAKGLGAVCASEQQTPQVSLPLLFRPQLFDGKSCSWRLNPQRTPSFFTEEFNQCQYFWRKS